MAIIPRCCPQRRTFFLVVAHNAEKFHFVAYNTDHFSALLPSTQKSAQISVHVCFSALLPIMVIIFPRCGPQPGKIIGVATYTVKNSRHCWQ
jgi:hypothetical protein